MVQEPEGLILVVDDEPDYVRPLQVRLQRLGKNYEFATVKDPETCLEFLQERLPNVIFLDYKLPQTTGIELLKILRERYPYVSIVILTGYSSEEVVIEALRAGANDYLTKPLKFDEVELVLRMNLERNRYRTAEAMLRRQLEESSFQLARTHQELEAVNARLVQKLRQNGENLGSHVVDITITVVSTLLKELSSLPDWGKLQDPLLQFLERHAVRVVSAYPVSIRELIGGVIALSEPILKRRNIRLRVNVPELPQVQIKGTYLEWIILSLIVRAIKVISEEGEIGIDVSRVQDQLVIEVTDTGWPPDISKDTITLLALSEMDMEYPTPADETNRMLYIQVLLARFLGGHLDIQTLDKEGKTKIILRFPWEEPEAGGE